MASTPARDRFSFPPVTFYISHTTETGQVCITLSLKSTSSPCFLVVELEPVAANHSQSPTSKRVSQTKCCDKKDDNKSSCNYDTRLGRVIIYCLSAYQIGIDHLEPILYRMSRFLWTHPAIAVNNFEHPTMTRHAQVKMKLGGPIIVFR